MKEITSVEFYWEFITSISKRGGKLVMQSTEVTFVASICMSRSLRCSGRVVG
jgi:hypothetical protein